MIFCDISEKIENLKVENKRLTHELWRERKASNSLIADAISFYIKQLTLFELGIWLDLIIVIIIRILLIQLTGSSGVTELLQLEYDRTIRYFLSEMQEKYSSRQPPICELLPNFDPMSLSLNTYIPN